ncbi:M23 family metallopeptidase [Paraliobacillus sp. X-1268]|uniref:M23 family metallopeptidase n=1 Tax=Paraliobacillus sp. X-1268 TaxID=2213193 RepID=UPI000E3E351A|nr:M23 family metallopeptidase [Paraliobacillus sp. X-1268]
MMRSNVKSSKLSIFKKTALITVLGIALTSNIAYAADDGLSTVYHVYMDGEHIGTTDSKDVITSYIDELITAREEANDTYAYVTKQEISYVPERVFNPDASNEEVLTKIEEDIAIQVNAYGLQIGDKIAGYFKNKEEAEKTLQQYKEKYVDKEILENLENADKDSDDEPMPLSVGDSAILEVELSEEVTYQEEKVNEDVVITVDQGIELLEKGTLQDKVHTVEEGDVLGSIAGQYDLTTEKLIALNETLSEDAVLQIGQELNVTEYAPFVNVVVTKEELVEEEIAYEKEVEQSDDLYKGEKEVKQEGQDGKKEVQYAIEISNGSVVSKEVINEEVTKEPTKEIIVEGTKVESSRGSGNFIWPTVGGYISSYMGERWGSYHKGIDIAGPSNRAIIAADNGTVESAGWDSGGYGNKVIINHNNGYKTVYAHLASISVSSGETVTQGEQIGVMGTTGNSTGIHLHIEVYKDGNRIDPASIF